MKNQIEKDIWDWITGYIEVNHKFYDYKFPPCPYARSARLNGLVKVAAYESGGMQSFIDQEASELLTNKTHNVLILVFPAWASWLFYLRWKISSMNKRIIGQDYYAQYGTALNTVSRYSGFKNGQPYFIVILNKLSDVINGHKALLKTDYYKPWDDFHYEDVVVRRQEAYEKYKKDNA